MRKYPLPADARLRPVVPTSTNVELGLYFTAGRPDNQRARAGYLITLHVVMVPVDLAVLRVQERVVRCGHDVPQQLTSTGGSGCGPMSPRRSPRPMRRCSRTTAAPSTRTGSSPTFVTATPSPPPPGPTGTTTWPERLITPSAVATAAAPLPSGQLRKRAMFRTPAVGGARPGTAVMRASFAIRTAGGCRSLNYCLGTGSPGQVAR
jgi:hypothetical protein